MNLRTLLALLVVSGGVVSALAAPSTPSLSVAGESRARASTSLQFTVRDVQGRAVPYACLRLTQEGTAVSAGPLWTGANGVAEIADLPAGAWRWTATAAAVGEQHGLIEVAAGAALEIEATLTARAESEAGRPVIDFGRGTAARPGSVAPIRAGTHRGAVTPNDAQVATKETALPVQERDATTNGDGKFSLPLTRTLGNSVGTGKSFSSLSYVPTRAAAPLVLADFGGAASNGAPITGTSWDGGAATQTGGFLFVTTPAVSEQGWGWNAAAPGDYLDLSAFNTVTVTAQQGAGNTASNFSILFFDPSETSTFVTLSMANFAGGMNAASGTISWGSVDSTKISKWTLGGDFPFSSDAFRLSIDSIVLTTAIPEPSTYAALAGAGALALAWWRRRRRA